MKIPILFVAGVTVCFLFCGQSVAIAGPPIPLHEAVRDGSVKLSVTGLGGSTGDVIQVVAQRQSKEVLRISLSPGTVFRSLSGTVQNMAGATIKGERVTDKTYRPSAEIILADDSEHTFVVEAYCMDFHKANPGTKDRFDVTPPDDRTVQVLAAGRKLSASVKVIQSALWIDRDGAPPEQLKQRFSVNDQDLVAAHALLQSLKEAASKPGITAPEEKPIVDAPKEAAKNTEVTLVDSRWLSLYLYGGSTPPSINHPPKDQRFLSVRLKLKTSIRSIRAEEFSVKLSDRIGVKGEAINLTPTSADVFYYTDSAPFVYAGPAEKPTWDLAVLFLIPKDAKPVALNWKDLGLTIPKGFFPNTSE